MGVNSSFPEVPQASSRSSALSRLTNTYAVSDTDLSFKDKKKKASKFATLRKKFTRSRRHSRTVEYGKAMRDMLSQWPTHQVRALVQEYESLSALKDLALLSNTARPQTNSLKHDLSRLFEYKFCTDIDLLYKGACFPAHRAVLCVRSPFFKSLLSKYPTYGSQVPVKLKTPGVDVTLFAAILKYLYTDNFNVEELQLEHKDVLIKLAEEFGMPNVMEQDLRMLLETGEHSDAVLVFSCDIETSDSDCMHASLLETSCGSEHSFKLSSQEVKCHKSILAARSLFFRNLLLRRARTGEEITDQALHNPSKIVLDENVLPRKYARVLLNAIYLDLVDLSLILRGSTSLCSLSEVQAMVTGKGQMSLIDEAMELYQIGQFLDLPALSQGCEDTIADSITTDNLISILNWSSEPHGSQWVYRQALHYLREEFLQISHSPVLLELKKEYLIEALSSDFLQAGELDVLSAVIKWGEYQLRRRIEEREPNLLSHTTHSVSKKGIKKRDLNDDELRDILTDIMPTVRVDHVIPYNSDILISAIKRGLISTPPAHLIDDDTSQRYRMSAWSRDKSNGSFVKPRLFLPYFEEAKMVLDEQLSQGGEADAGYFCPIQMSSIPDTLYMVEDPHSLSPGSRYGLGHRVGHNSSAVDIIAGTIPVPDGSTLNLMVYREQELRSSPQVQRAYSLPCCSKNAITYQLQLRVVREFGLPDTTTELLHSRHDHHFTTSDVNLRKQYLMQKYHVPKSKQRQSSPLSLRSRYNHNNESSKPVVCISPSRSRVRSSKEVDSSHNNDCALSDVMPDIAMATASVGQMHIQEELELDIGDRNSHCGPMYI